MGKQERKEGEREEEGRDSIPFRLTVHPGNGALPLESSFSLSPSLISLCVTELQWFFCVLHARSLSAVCFVSISLNLCIVFCL